MMDLLGIGTAIAGVVGNWLEGRRQIKQAKNDLKIAELQNKTRLMLSESEMNHDWEMQSLKHNPAPLRYISFSLFSAPIIIAAVYPEQGDLIWKSLNTIPDWYMWSYMSMVAGIWGVSELRSSGLKIPFKK